MNKKIILIIIGIVVVITLISVVLVNIGKRAPPKIKFISDGVVEGKIFLNEMQVGIVRDSEFDSFPEYYCNDFFDVKLETDELVYNWRSQEDDCNMRTIKYNLNNVNVVKKESISLVFGVKDSYEKLNGNLFFDGKQISEINGSYDIDLDTCNSISEIRIEFMKENVKNFASWDHNKGSCEIGATLKYTYIDEEAIDDKAFRRVFE